MAGIGARAIGPVGAAIADPLAHIELIADGIHVSPTLIRTLFSVVPDRIVLVTDAMAAAGSASGRYRLGSLDVEVTDDGIGGADPARGSGLKGLEDRVEALDGTLEVESPPGAGTRIRARIPTARRVIPL